MKRNACQTTTDHHTSPVGTAELCRSIVCLLSVNPYRVQIHLMKIIA
ncbi:MAG: hypothetical protein II981_05395 [Bacteroidales bacterium]|nr:hypothetical protein [Bacteroidales bacterium]